MNRLPTASTATPEGSFNSALVAAPEEPSEIAGEVAPAGPACQRAELGRDGGQGQSHPARLARLLPGEPPDGPEWSGGRVAATPAGDAAQTGAATRLRAE